MSVTEQLLVAVFTFFELCLQNLTSYPHLFFWSKYFPWKVFLIIEIRKKKSSIKIFAASVSTLKYVQIKVIFSHKPLK